MKKVLAVSALTLLATSSAYADSYNITSGTFNFWQALSPGTTKDSNADGTTDCLTGISVCVGQFGGTNSLGTVTAGTGATIAMNVTGTVTFGGVGTAGAVTALVLNEVGTSNNVISAGVVTLTTTGMQWTWSATGGNLGTDSLRQTAGTATCTGTSPTNSGCVNTAPAITDNVDSVWNWDGIGPPMRVAAGAINPVDRQAFEHSVSGLTMTVSTSSRTPFSNDQATGTFSTANAGQYTLNLQGTVVPAPAAVWLLGTGLGLLGVRRFRSGKRSA